jgi:hypothetical protein
MTQVRAVSPGAVAVAAQPVFVTFDTEIEMLMDGL